MASTVTVKAYLTRPGKPDEIRRFAVDENVSTSYDYLVKKIGQVFQDENNMTLAWKGGCNHIISLYLIDTIS